MREKKDWLSGHNVRKTADLARQYHEHGFALQANGSKDVLANSNVSEDEARKVWYDTGKHEKYALFGEMIDRTVTTAESHIPERSPFGLVRKIDREHEVVRGFFREFDLFDQARLCFDDTLISAHGEVMDQFEKDWQNPTSGNEKDGTLYKRCLDWINFGKSNIERNESLNTNAFLSQPITHATGVMTDVLRVTPSVYIRDTGESVPSPADLTNVALYSYPIVAYLTSFELYSFTEAKRYLNGQRMDRHLSADQFTLVEDTRGLRKLAFTSKIKNDLDQIRSNTNLMRGPRLTCPAMIDFGDESAMQRLWWWHVVVGEAIYQYLYPTKNPKSAT